MNTATLNHEQLTGQNLYNELLAHVTARARQKNSNLTRDHDLESERFASEFPINQKLIAGATVRASQKKMESEHQAEGTKDVTKMIYPLSHFLDSQAGKQLLALLSEAGEVIHIAQSGGFAFVLKKNGFFKIYPDRRNPRRLANREILERFCNPSESMTEKEQEPEDFIPFLIAGAEQIARRIS